MTTSSIHAPLARFFTLAASAVSLAALIASASAKPVPENLSNGLDKLVENNLIQKGVITAAPATASTQIATQTSTKAGGKRASRTSTAVTQANAAQSFDAYKTAVAKQAAMHADAAISDSTTAKYLVEIMPNGRVPVEALQSSLQARFPSISVMAVDTKYVGHGVIEGYVSLDDVPAIAGNEGVGSVILQLRPIHSAVTAQSVNQHRVNRINSFYNPNVSLNWDGTGISIGVMSDSFDSQPSEEGGSTTAAGDVATQDLPGPGNMANSQPVVVLQDFLSPPGATNEGRAMCQIVHDMAPKARIGFATADTGELGFANNIRALGGLPGFTYPASTQQGFKGDVVCDDVSYLDEPMFQDGIIAQGVNDVVAAGVTYCSSAANNWAIDGYESAYRPVANGSGLTPATNAALKNTTINLANVPAELYAGGFHNFNPSGDPTKQDVAQTINSGSNALAFVFQWNDPYDSSAPVLIDPPIFTGSGDSEGGAAVDFQVNLTAGNSYVITEKATPVTPADNFDAIVGVIDPNGKTIIDQDTGIDETVTFFPQITGTYTLHVHPYATPVAGGVSVPTRGPFSIKVNQAQAPSTMTQDFNILYFDMNGNYIPAQSLTTNNLINNRPIELNVPALPSPQVQMVISRSNTTAPANAANFLKYVYFGNGTRNCGPAEYTSYLMPVTFGHSAAAGANSVAAYDVFRPNIPEYFTSTGPVTIFFDANSNRLATPQVRLKPDVAAGNGVNNTFFPLGNIPVEADSVYDPDNFANFYGTSAASPNAAALAALVLQSHGGPGSLSPQKVKTILQLTAFPHDLDPFVARGAASAANGGKIDIFISSDGDTNLGLGANDPNSWNLSYTGPGYVKTLNFNLEGTPQTGGNTTGGNFNGFTPADFLNPALYRFTPGMVFISRFLTGNSVGLTAADATFTRSNPAPPPSNPNPMDPTEHDWTATLTFADNKLSAGNIFRFNIGRLQQQDATTPQGLTTNSVSAPVINRGVTLFRPDASADLLGDGVFIPEDPNGTNIQPGMTFTGTIVDGGNTIPFSGRLKNKIGRGFTPLDGFGFINAEAATAATLPVPGVVSRMTHGAAGTFDIELPFAGPAGIECRTNNVNYTLVFTFDRALATAGSAAVSQGTATVAQPILGPMPNQVTVELSSVPNQQHLVISLSNVHDTADAVLAAVSARMDVLVGDTNKDGSVNSADIGQTKSQSGVAISNSNFREDLNADGSINSADISLVKSRSGTGLAP
ncbi:MAG: S8 family serine peptidase [Spartobacteria bacterium]